MSRSLIGWIVAAVVAVGLGALAWLFFAGGSGEPTAELTTPTIAADTTAPGDTTATEDIEPDDTVAGATTAFVIDADQSEASFEIDEVLRGSPNTVVGSTNEVAGQVQFDPSDLSSVEFSQIVINARTFATDSGFRDRAIRGPVILNSASDEFELITFDITSVDGLEGSVAVGDTLQFTVTGELTIRGETSEAAFAVEATYDDTGIISGIAETTVLRSDFGIGIPNAPGVADVGDEVIIRLEFVATAN